MGLRVVDRHGFVQNDTNLFLLFEFQAFMGSLRYYGL